MIYFFNFLIFSVTIIAFFVFIWVLGNVLSVLFLTNVPSVQTDKKYFKQIFSQLDINEKTVIYDLGCGNGNFLLYCLKFNPLKVVGYELSLWPYLSAKIKALIWGQNKMKIIFKNFFKVDFNEADIIYLYLTKPVLKKFSEELIKKIKSKTIIVVKGEPLPKINYYSKINLDEKRNYCAYVYKFN